MAKSVSSIYDNIENLVPFYPDVVYSQSKDGRPKDEIELKLDKMDEDAMFLKRTLGVSYEQVLRWFRGDATNLDRNECEEAMKRLLSNCKEKVRNHLIDICSRYSLPIVGESICSQKTSSLSSEVKSDITAMKQVRTTNAQVATHLTQEVQVEVSDEKEILHPSRDTSRYWQWYCDSWDDFVRSWFDERRGNPICTEYKRIVDGYRKCVKDLNCDELPEPYQGDPKSGVDAVVLNLNPGMSQKGHYGSYEGNDLEATKFYSNIDVSSELVPSGWLIKKFRDEANCSYRDYVTRWSCLNPDLRRHEPEVCGVYWWQVDGRMNWVRQIYGNDQLCSSRVFAPEICPFHSKSLPTDDFQELNSFISEHVIVPTMMAVIENKLPFAVAIGKAFAILLERIGRDDKFGISAKLEKEWWEESDDVEDWQWPEARDDETGEMRRVHRKYCLFALKDKNGYLARFLVCVAPGSNGTPSEDFSLNIEKKLILPYVKNNPLTSELYESLTSKTLRWWNINKANDQAREEARKMRVSHGDKKQLYKNLWNGFCNWCKQNAKSWCTVNLAPTYYSNSLDPAGRRNPHLFFRVSRDKDSHQLYLGIYSSMRKDIKKKCQAGLEQLGKVDWSYGHEGQGTTSILIPVDGDWRTPGDDLYAEMASLFERVGSTLRARGFRI